MNRASKVLTRIIEWARLEDAIRGLVMVGSRALDQSDDLSDFDISVFTTDKTSLANHDSWISEIANVWVCSPDHYDWEGIRVPTRLVIYEGGAKVDYCLWDANVIDRLGQSGFFDTGCRVLMDKDGRLANLKKESPTVELPKRPTVDEVTRTINEFWFEAYHVAK